MAKKLANDELLLSTDNSVGLSGLLAAVLAQAQIIQAADNVIDDKSNNLMAAALVVMALLATQLKDVTGRWHVLTIIAMAVLSGVVGLVIYLTRTQKYYGAVVDINKHTDYFSMHDAPLLAQLTGDAQYANDYNEAILTRKQQFFRYSVYIFLLGFGLGLISLFINA